MNKRLKNRFDAQVVFSDFSFSIKNRPDANLTPEDVATSLEEFCARIRNGGKLLGASGSVHGVTCLKAAHDPRGSYLHAEDDDRPYDVDGVTYCGRCHVYWPRRVGA